MIINYYGIGKKCCLVFINEIMSYWFQTEKLIEFVKKTVACVLKMEFVKRCCLFKKKRNGF